MRLFKINNACLKKSRFVYWICKTLRLKGDFKINIYLKYYDDGRPDTGHAWLTRDGKDFAFAFKSLPFKLEKIGENEKYVYWTKSREDLVNTDGSNKTIIPIRHAKS